MFAVSKGKCSAFTNIFFRKRQSGDLWQYLLVLYLPHTIHGPRNQCHGTIPIRFTTSAVSAHPGQTASIFCAPVRNGSRALKVSIRGLPKDCRRPPGRLRHTWLHALEADLQPLNLGLISSRKYTQDREHWKHLVETATFQLGACARWSW